MMSARSTDRGRPSRRVLLALIVGAILLALGGRGEAAAEGPTAATVDGSDRLTTPGFSYDANGNLLSDGTTTYTYDTANRLIKSVAGSLTVEYKYDGLGNLIQVKENGVTSNLVLDEASSLPRVLGEVKGTQLLLYAHGPTGLAAQKVTGATPGGVMYPLVDAQGTPRHLTDSTGATLLSRYYDAWGERRHQTGSAWATLGYAGEREGADGTIYLRARMLQPGLGRFLQRDTMDPGLMWGRTQEHHRYSYAMNNPTTYSDPSGHFVPLVVVGGMAAATVAGMMLTPDPVAAPEDACYQSPGVNWGNEALALGADLLLDGPGLPEKTLARHAANGLDAIPTRKGIPLLGPPSMRDLKRAGRQPRDFMPGRTPASPYSTISGHGSIPRGSVMTVPPGTEIWTLSPAGSMITDDLGRIADVGGDLSGFPTKVYHPGQKMPDITIHPPTGLNIGGSPITVNQPTPLSEVIRQNGLSGPICVSTCQVINGGSSPYSGRVYGTEPLSTPLR